MEAKRRYINVNDTELFVEEMGSGQPIVFVPGWTMTLDFFKHQLPYFAENHRAITFDPRGQGRSAKPIEGHTFAQRGRDLAGLLDALDLRGVILVGWSYGAYDAYAYVREFGADNLKAFVSIDEGPRSVKRDTDDWGEGDFEEIAGVMRAVTADRRGFMSSYASFMTGREDPEETAWIVEQTMQTPEHIARLILTDGLFEDFTDAARRVDEAIPALNIVREEVARTAKVWMTRETPNIKLASFGPHMMFWTDVTRFNETLGNFFETLHL